MTAKHKAPTIDAATRKVILAELKALRAAMNHIRRDFGTERRRLEKQIRQDTKKLAALDKRKASRLAAIERRISISSARL